MPNLIDLTGQTFNRLTVIKRADKKIKGKCAYWGMQMLLRKSRYINYSKWTSKKRTY